ncbi:MAG: ATP--guanido phosphotransferase [Clostridia bacterium]|nr:ATP--guanido phosphotransferase [Clostridia bacterium]
MTDYIVISSRARLARNLSGVKFPSKITPDEVSVVERAAIAAAKKVFDAAFYRISDLDDSDVEYLVEGHFISRTLLESPYAALILSKDKKMSVMLQEEDHIRSQYILPGLALQECFAQVKEYDQMLRGETYLAYDKQLGYLTACPTNVGTGLRASVMMFLPALSMAGGIGELENELKSANLTIRGALGEGTKAEGYRYQISNAISLGVAEETILNRVESAAGRIREIEMKTLAAQYDRDRFRMEDSVLRSDAILRSARILTQDELETLIVYEKIGVALGLIDATNVDLDALTLLCKSSSLKRLVGAGANIDAQRAETVRKAITQKEE